MENFITPYKGYDKTKLPERFRHEKVYDFIKDNAKRVVKVIYKSSSTIIKKGSGIVFKLGGNLCIQTNHHVVREILQDWLNIEIVIGDWSCKIDTYWGGCQKHDMAVLELRNGPNHLRKRDITDINQQVVDITVAGEPYKYKGLVEYHRGEGRFVVHALNFIQRRLDDDTEITCKFRNSRKRTCSMKDVCYCSETGCAIIFLDEQIIPNMAKSMFESQTFWETMQDPLVVVLSYPGEEDKHISTGNVMHEEYDNPATTVCFKVEEDNETCRFGDSTMKPEEISNEEGGNALGLQSAIKRGRYKDVIVDKAEGVYGGTTYFLVNSKSACIKFPITEDVSSFFSCRRCDTNDPPVNKNDNRQYFYLKEGRVYFCCTNDPTLHTTEILSGSEKIFKVEINGNTVLPQSWKDTEQMPIKLSLLEESVVPDLDTSLSNILKINVYRIQDKVYFEGKINGDANPVYFLVGRDEMVISRDEDNADMYIQTDINGNKGFFKVNEDGYKTCVYQSERARYLLEEDHDGTRVYFEEEEGGNKRYCTERIQDFRTDQNGSRIFRRTDTKEDQEVYYRNKARNNPFQIDEKNNKVYLQIDYKNKKLYTLTDTNKFAKIHKVIHLNHNAETAPGSSGGCVLVIAKDKENQYKCLVCMHKGRFKKQPVNKAIVCRLKN